MNDYNKWDVSQVWWRMLLALTQYTPFLSRKCAGPEKLTTGWFIEDIQIFMISMPVWKPKYEELIWLRISHWYLIISLMFSIKRWLICTSRPRRRSTIWISSFWNAGSISWMNIYLVFWNPSFWRPMPISRATSCSFWVVEATSTAKERFLERSSTKKS